MQPDIMAAIITALINFTRVWEGETAVAAGDREREREGRKYTAMASCTPTCFPKIGR